MRGPRNLWCFMARFPVVRVERYKIVELKTYFKFIPRTIKRDLKVKKRARLVYLVV